MLLSVEILIALFYPSTFIRSSQDNCMACSGKRRRLHLRRRSKSAPAVFLWHSPVKCRKQKTNSQMEKTMDAVKSGVGINRAAMECGVPRTTLKECIGGRINMVLIQDR